MTEPANPTSRKRSSRRSRGDAGQWMLGVVLVLTVAGTGLWILSDDRRWALVSLILLIWGLVIAAFLIARYARELRSAEAKEGSLKAVYELQLEREISARREYELQLEKDVRAELRNESNEELTALKAEVLALRANLEELLGRDLGPSYTELYAAAQQRAIDAQRTKSNFDIDDRANAQHDFNVVPDSVADVDNYYGAGSAADEQSRARPAARPPVPPRQPPPSSAPSGGREPGFAYSGPAFGSPAYSGPVAPEPVVAEPVGEPTPRRQPVGDPPTAILDAVIDAPQAEPVDVEHVDHVAPPTEEPFVPMAPQSGYRPPARHAPKPQVPPSSGGPGPVDGAAPLPTTVAQFAPPPPPNAPAGSDSAAPAGAGTDPARPGDGTRGQHSTGSSVAELLARMNADTQRTTGGRRRRADE